MQINQNESMTTDIPHGWFGLRKYRLTMVFLVASALIFAAVAIAINISTIAAEEEQIVSITTTESIKDAKTIAGIVTDLLDSNSDDLLLTSIESPSSGSSVGISQFLSDSEIVGLNIYEPNGELAWSSSLNPLELGDGQREIFAGSLEGSIATGLVKNSLVAPATGSSFEADVVETYVPLVDSESGEVALVLGVTRDVTTLLSTSIDQSRSAIFQSTLISLGAGFVVLLAFVFIADVRLWRQRELAIAYERESASTELSVAKLNLANRELQQVTDEREKILSSVSHELKTPLTSIVAFTDILARNQGGDMKARNLKHLEIVKRSSGNLLSLINDLLTFNRMSPVDTRVSIDSFDLGELVDELQEAMAPVLAGKRQSLMVNGVESVPPLRMDRRRILQALMNLVSNSSKFSRYDSVVLMDFRANEAVLGILVADPGVGMSLEKQQELMEAQRAVGDSNEDGGLGFVITKDIVEAHGGRISIDSRPDQGTRVTIKLPLSLSRRYSCGSSR